ncbi:hypothetical protein AUG19_02295 [archaeon 13_1_20CM_2_54_9]|nr:MAG: hypothetical protein AUJ07_03895 [Crenarchaeota archaeon 13_1_40CM_3_53_5]OLE76677.1 MAG: hypothetical protein AUG19_02295 [archaeon 13_1_20CM_2_54_9]
MALLPLSLIIVLILWMLGFMLIERKTLISGIVAIACFLFPILIFGSALEYITENSGTVASTTLILSSTTQGQLVLMDVFFLFIALLNGWNIINGRNPEEPKVD